MSVIQPKPSKICGGCMLYGNQCHCVCHKQPVFHGYHEIAWLEPQEIIMRHPEDD